MVVDLRRRELWLVCPRWARYVPCFYVLWMECRYLLDDARLAARRSIDRIVGRRLGWFKRLLVPPTGYKCPPYGMSRWKRVNGRPRLT